MRRLLAPFASVERFYLDGKPIEPMVLIRILMGGMFTFRYAIHGPDFGAVFGPEGLMAHVIGPNWVLDHAWLVYTVIMVSALAFTFGFVTRIAGLVLIVCHVALHYQTWGYAWGDATTGHLFILYTLFADPGGRLSVDAWIRQRRHPERALPTRVHALGMRMLQMHICVIYFMASYSRLFNAGWLSGRMTYVAVNHAIFSRFVNVDFSGVKTLLWLATWYTWIIELGAPLLLWLRKTRVLWVVLLALMHLGLHLTSTIGSWQLHMMAVLLVFLPPGRISKFVRDAERVVGIEPPPRDPWAPTESPVAARTLSVFIERSPEQVERFARNGRNLPRWTNFSFLAKVGDAWQLEAANGPVTLRFVSPERSGLLDHRVEPVSGVDIYVPMRVVPSRGGAELLLTLLRPPEMSDEGFEGDTRQVARDLDALRAVLEASTA